MHLIIVNVFEREGRHKYFFIHGIIMAGEKIKHVDQAHSICPISTTQFMITTHHFLHCQFGKR